MYYICSVIELIKKAIKHLGNQKSFADSIGIRQATLSGFLSGADIRVSTLKKIMEKAGLEIASSEPNQLMQREFIIIDGNRFHVGEFTSDKLRVELCFGSTHTTKQGVILKNVDTNKLELIII